MSQDPAFAAALRELRMRADLTLEQLSAASGVSVRAISDMERGVSRGPQAKTVAALADALHLTGADRSALLAAARAGRQRGAGEGPESANRCPMPRRLPDFVGRRPEIDRLTAHAVDPSVAQVTLISGSAGMGKTSLAVQAAAELADAQPDGQLFVDLRGMDPRPPTALVVLERLIRAVHPGITSVPKSVDAASALWRSVIEGLRVVVILDNAASEGQVRPALPAAGPAVVLITSRRTLPGLRAVRRIALKPLPPEFAVGMLAGIVPDRAAALTGLSRLAELCANVPLALRIAGNRLASRPGWTVEDLVARLTAEERRLDGLAVGDLSVKAAFELSYKQLSGVARRLFRRLALVPGSSTGTPLAAVLAEEPLTITEVALDELLELGLVQLNRDGRISFNDLLRLYAGAQLRREESARDRASATLAARDWLLDTTVVAGRWYEPEFGAPPPGATRLVELGTADAARTWLTAEADNWLAALRASAADGNHRRVVEVADSLHWFSDLWVHWGYWDEVFTLSAQAADRLDDDLLRATHRGYLAWVNIAALGDPAEGSRQSELAYRHALRAGDVRQQGWARLYGGWARWSAGEHTAALALATEAAGLLRAAPDREGLPQALGMIGNCLRDLGRHQAALDAYQEVLQVVRQPESAPRGHLARLAEMVVNREIAQLHHQLGQWREAVDLGTAALGMARELGHPRQVAVVLSRRAEVYVSSGDTAAAVADLRAVEQVQRETDDEAGLRRTRRRLAELR